MWLFRIGLFFTDRDHKFARDYLTIAGTIVFFAAIAANLLALRYSPAPAERPTLRIATVQPVDLPRNYTHVRSVLDDEIVTGSAQGGAGQIRLDPCKPTPLE
jgi:hypothetical protein